MGFAGSLAVGAIGLGLSAYQGQTSLATQKKSLQRQDEAQARNEAAAASARLKAQTDINEVDRKKPDIAAILAASKSSFAANPTMLTGPGGLGKLGGS